LGGVYSLGQLIKIIRQPQMETVVDKLIDFSGGQDEELRDISGLGMTIFFLFCSSAYLVDTQRSRQSPPNSPRTER
jgi:hypothetical protein